MGLTKDNIISIIFIIFLVLTMFAIWQMQERYKEAKASCDYCWNLSQGCQWTVEIYNLSVPYNITHDDLNPLGEG